MTVKSLTKSLIVLIFCFGLLLFYRNTLMVVVLEYVAKQQGFVLSAPSGVELYSDRLNIQSLIVQRNIDETELKFTQLEIRFSIIHKNIDQIHLEELFFHQSTSDKEEKSASSLSINNLMSQWQSLPVDRISVKRFRFNGQSYRIIYAREFAGNDPERSEQVDIVTGDYSLGINVIWQNGVPILDSELKYQGVSALKILMDSARERDQYHLTARVVADIASLSRLDILKPLLPPELTNLAGNLQIQLVTQVPETYDPTTLPPIQIAIDETSNFSSEYTDLDNSLLDLRFRAELQSDLIADFDSAAGLKLRNGKVQMDIQQEHFPNRVKLLLESQYCVSLTDCIAAIKMNVDLQSIEREPLILSGGRLAGDLLMTIDGEKLRLFLNEGIDLSVEALKLEAISLQKFSVRTNPFVFDYNFKRDSFALDQTELTVRVDDLLRGSSVEMQQSQLAVKLQAFWCENRNCQMDADLEVNLKAATVADISVDTVLLTKGVSLERHYNGLMRSEFSDTKLEIEGLSQGDLRIKDLLINAKQSVLSHKLIANESRWQFRLPELGLSMGDSTYQEYPVEGGLALESLDAVFGDRFTLKTELNLQDARISQKELWSPVFDIQANVHLSDSKIDVDGSAFVDDRVFQTFELSHQLVHSRGSGTFTLERHDFGTLPLSEYFNIWPFELDLVAGTLMGQATVDWHRGSDRWKLEGVLTTQLEKSSGFYSDIAFVDTSAFITANITEAGIVSSEPIKISSRTIDIGFPIDALEGEFMLNSPNQELYLLSGGAELLGGRVTLNAYHYPEKEDSPLRVEMTELQLEEILSLAEYKAVMGEGSISGMIPIHIKDKGMTVTNGVLGSDGPGILRYNVDEVAKSRIQDPSLTLVMQALNNYHYEALESTVFYNEQGKLSLGMKLKGANPDFNNGQQINLNLNVTDDIPSLLKSLQSSRVITDILQQKIK